MQWRSPGTHLQTSGHIVQGIVGNARLSEWYLALARDLDVMEPRSPEDVYKLHLAEGRAPAGPAVDSARQNMSSSLVNGLVNAGFGQVMTLFPCFPLWKPLVCPRDRLDHRGHAGQVMSNI